MLVELLQSFFIAFLIVGISGIISWIQVKRNKKKEIGTEKTYYCSDCNTEICSKCGNIIS